VRDEHGVPTIEAATLDDLFFAEGYVTAQDRLWQMDMMRRLPPANFLNHWRRHDQDGPRAAHSGLATSGRSGREKDFRA